VHVWSHVSTTNGVAQRWSDDVDLLAEPDEWRTTFVMPARDVTLKANSTPRALALETETFTGVTDVAKTVRYHLPERMRGVVLFNHGTGGSGAFIESTEAFPIALALVADGYGVVSIDAEEAAAGDLNGDGKQRWNGRASTTNVDLGNLEALFDSFEARGLIPAGTTKFALGMSAGGNFSHLLGTIGATPVAAELPQLRFAAVVSYCADATASRSSSLSTTPSAWYMCAADDNSEVSNAEARANEAELRRRGVATDYAENAPTPLYDQRFTRIDGIDVATSTAMAAELRAAGFTDAAGLITRSSDEIAAIVSADPASFPTITSIPRPNLVRLQLKVMRAEHAMFADMTRRTIDFFDRFNPMPPT
jgi:acetyl esterase/lipase